MTADFFKGRNAQAFFARRGQMRIGRIFLLTLGVCVIAYLCGLKKMIPVLPLIVWFITSVFMVCCGIVTLFKNWREAGRFFFSFPLLMFFFASLIWLGFASYAVNHPGGILSFLWSVALLVFATACIAGAVILVFAILLNAPSRNTRRRRASPRSSGWMSGLASASAFDDDWMTNPAYSHMPGNIHHSDDSFSSSSFDWMDSSSSSSSSSSDWMTDPAYSYMPGNIYHTDDSFSSSSTDWMTDPSYSFMSGNIYHTDDSFHSSSFSDDLFSSSSSSSFSDDSFSSFSSSSSDDSFSSFSSFNSFNSDF